MAPDNKHSCFANDRLRVSITDTCNLNCNYCSNEGQNHNNKKYLNVENYRIFLEKIKKEKIYIRKLNITGGEPLLHHSLLEILRESIDVADEVTLNTNGLLLTNDNINQFREIGLTNIKFGVDWVFGDMIKPSKNKPKFNQHQYIQNIMHAVEVMPRTSLNIVISEFNSVDIERMLDFVIDNKIDKVEFLEIIEHDFRHTGDFSRRVLSAKELINKLSNKFSRVEYNAKLAKYICYLENGLMVQFAEDFCRRAVCQNLWTRMDVNCDISPCLKDANTYSLDMESEIAPQIRMLNYMMCDSEKDHFPWSWSEELRKDDKYRRDANQHNCQDMNYTVYESSLDP